MQNSELKNNKVRKMIKENRRHKIIPNAENAFFTRIWTLIADSK